MVDDHCVGLRADNDCHDDTIDRHRLAENDGNQVLAHDPWHTNTQAEEAGSGNEDSPCSTDDR